MEHVRVACRSGDLTLGRDVFLVLDIGAGGLHDAAKGKYEITQGHHKLAQDWVRSSTVQGEGGGNVKARKRGEGGEGEDQGQEEIVDRGASEEIARG